MEFAQALLIVHGLAGDEIGINPRAIVTVTEPVSTMTRDAHCQINLVGGKFVSTRESCQEVWTLMAKAPTGGHLDGK
jgi:hypothetical protein